MEWGAGDAMFIGAPPVESQYRFRFPTQELGEWLLVEASDVGVRVTLVGPDQTRTRRFSEDCSSTTIEEASQLSTDSAVAFTDHDLRRVVESVPDGGLGVVVYVWSPHMPLSVEGYSEIAGAAQNAGLHLVSLLFPGSDPDFAATEARRVGIPDHGFRESASLELVFRDALVHAPSIIVFGGGRVSAVLPGYRNAEGYREFLAEFVAPS